ncbi:DUF6300 family protein [Streptomyces sp. NPDC088725]|uniref:DUF6300 family protein n=1 Tax=Streptomyces sp. NPDC088725 TaxID=3365873 RepID=UPI003830C002
MSGDGHGLAVRLDDAPECPGCGTPGLLRVSFPHVWLNQSGREVRGTGEAVLCPLCHSRAPAAAELLALFAVDGSATDENMHMLVELAVPWATAMSQRSPDSRSLAEEETLWRLGEL